MSAADRLAVICEGEEFPVPASSDAAFRERFLALTEGGYEMPAFGVSLDKVVKEALKEGLWLKFYYSETKSYLEMPFDALAVRLEPGYSGLEFMRENKGKFSGRDYYFSLVKEIGEEFCSFLKAVKGE